MSNALAIATVTVVLQDVLLGALVNASAAEQVNGAEVVAAYPGSDAAVSGGKPRIGIYLYQVAPNPALRNAALPARPGAVALDLHYLLSFYGSEDTFEPQRILGIAARALATHGAISRAAIDKAVAGISRSDVRAILQGSDLSKAVELIKIAPLHLSIEELTRMWSAFFQVKYALSVTYQCSVVVIDADAPAHAPKPVLQRALDVVPFARPAIARVVAASGDDDPITPGATVLVAGTDLVGQATSVLAGGVEVASLAEATARRIRFALPAGLRAGVQSLVVVQRFLLGVPPVPHAGIESSPAAFVLRPVVTSIQRTIAGGATVLTVAFDPPAGETQRVTLLLHRGTAASPVQIFAGPARDRETATVDFAVTADVLAGTWVATLLVDGAESPSFTAVLA